MKKIIVLIACIIAGLYLTAQNCTQIRSSDLPLTIAISPSSANLCPDQTAYLESNVIHPSKNSGRYDFIWYQGYIQSGNIVQDQQLILL